MGQRGCGVSAEIATVAESEALAVAALDEVERVSTPEEADRLLRMITAYQAAVRLAQIGREHEQRWAGVRLRAERKMGELLGPAEKGGDRRSSDSVSHGLAPADRKAHERVRRIAAIHEKAFTEYLENADEPTRAGLLRAAQTQEPTELEPASDAHTKRIARTLGEFTGASRDLEAIDMRAVVAAISHEDRKRWAKSLREIEKPLRALRAALREAR